MLVLETNLLPLVGANQHHRNISTNNLPKKFNFVNTILTENVLLSDLNLNLQKTTFQNFTLNSKIGPSYPSRNASYG
jgi:hypothetical protein